jgi:hypothetical protein
MPSTAERIDRIARKVRERGLHLGPPLDETALADFESGRGVTLPEGFRAFLQRVGNGGGRARNGPPDCGLLALGEVPEDMTESESRPSRDVARLRRSFPFTRAWIWEEGEGSDEGTREQVWDGNLHLGTDGCAQYWVLVVTGPERGNVWMLTGVGITPAGPKADFLQWFEDWLDTGRAWPA